MYRQPAKQQDGDFAKETTAIHRLEVMDLYVSKCFLYSYYAAHDTLLTPITSLTSIIIPVYFVLLLTKQVWRLWKISKWLQKCCSHMKKHVFVHQFPHVNPGFWWWHRVKEGHTVSVSEEHCASVSSCQPWRQRQHVSLKRHQQQPQLHTVTLRNRSTGSNCES